MFDVIYDGNYSNKKVGNHQTFKGNNLTVVGNHNQVIGDNNTVIGNHNKIFGYNITLTGNHNKVFGDADVKGNHNKVKKLKDKNLKKYKKITSSLKKKSKTTKPPAPPKDRIIKEGKTPRKPKTKDWGLKNDLTTEELDELNSYMKTFEQ